MKSLFSFIVFTFINIQIFGLVCNQVNNSDASELLIKYKGGKPSELFLRSPSQEIYRKQDVLLQTIRERGTGHVESFNVMPNHEGFSIDWSSEVNCFKEVGAQWYFNFFYSDDVYYVFIMPFYVKSFDGCVTPRSIPQKHELSCYED